MNILEYIKSLFITNNIYTTELVLETSIITMHGRKIFKNKTEYLETIDKYKDEYNKILNEKKYVMSRDFDVLDTNKTVVMLADLVFNLSTDKIKTLDYINKDIVYDKEIANLIEESIKVKKLKKYLEEAFKIELEVILKHIALSEIYNRRKFFLKKNKKDALSFAIDNLKLTYRTIQNYKTSIFLNILSYINENGAFNTNTLTSKEYVFLMNYLQHKKWELDKFNDIIGEESIIINDAEELLNHISSKEITLEKYVYNNKDRINEIRESLFLVDYLSRDKNIRKTNLNILSRIEKETVLFYEYARNIVTKEDLYKLYETKFILLTNNDILFFGKNLITDETKEYEKEIYKEVVMKKIDSILKGKNMAVRTKFGEDNYKAIRLISKILKGSENIYDAEKIITDEKRFNLLLSFSLTFGLDNYFKLYNVYKNNYKWIDFYEDALLWDEKLPLETVYKIAMANNDNANDDLFKLYKLKVSHERISSLESYKLPEGLAHINSFSSLTPNQEKKLKNIIAAKAEKRIVELPSTLKTLTSNIFENTTVYNIILNDGLETLSLDSLSSSTSEILTIPSSLKHIIPNLMMREYTQCWLRNVHMLEFKDYKNSKIIFNTHEMFNLFKNFLYYENKEWIDSGSFAMGVTYDIFYNQTFEWIRLIDGDNITNINVNDLLKKCNIVKVEDRDYKIMEREIWCLIVELHKTIRKNEDDLQLKLTNN